MLNFATAGWPMLLYVDANMKLNVFLRQLEFRTIVGKLKEEG